MHVRCSVFIFHIRIRCRPYTLSSVFCFLCDTLKFFMNILSFSTFCTVFILNILFLVISSFFVANLRLFHFIFFFFNFYVDCTYGLQWTFHNGFQFLFLFDKRLNFLINFFSPVVSHYKKCPNKLNDFKPFDTAIFNCKIPFRKQVYSHFWFNL